MNWTHLPLRDGLEQYAPQWQALNSERNAAHPLLCLDYMQPLVQHFSTAEDLLAVHHQPNGGVDAMLALSGGAMKWQTFRPSQAQLAPALFFDNEAVPHLLRELPGSAMVLDLMCLDPLFTPSLAPAASSETECSDHATTLQVHIDGSFEDYWQGRVRKLQADIQNKLNRLKADGCVVQLLANETPAAVLAAFARYAVTECDGWKGREGTAVKLGTAQGDFYADVMSRFAAQGRATVFEFLINGQLAASQLVVRSGEMAVMLKTTHVERLARYAPGLLMGHHILQHEFRQRRVKQVEYYTAADHLKLRWGTAQRQIFHRRYFRHAVARSLVQGLAQLRHLGRGEPTTTAKAALAKV
jgi:CelD/BcsL family acetyltransferase involved in cellulose biosynthesis